MKSLSLVKFACSLSLLLAAVSFAAEVTQDNAEKAVIGWLHSEISPMPDRQVTSVAAVTDENGDTNYYLSSMSESGFVVLSADDELEPVIAFSTSGYFDMAKGSPLKDLLDTDIKYRLKAVQSNTNKSSTYSATKAKWLNLITAGTLTKKDDLIQATGGISSLSDLRISPLLQSQWSQGDVGDIACYNYYTPNQYPSGCVATAMAQMMRYHSWPTSAIGALSFQIWVNSVSQNQNTRGGDGSGGAYNWDEMPYVPASGVTTAQRQAIGALCYDAGLSVNMSYTDSGSGASTSSASEAFCDTFGYSSSVYGSGFSSGISDDFLNMVNANLDAHLPVILSISGPSASHAVIADGYGYSDDTMYHHMNMGWGGIDDTWYALPVIDSSYYFNTINGCIYNIYPNSSGEIISGRIVSLAGAALEDVTVTAYNDTTTLSQTTTDSCGIYALTDLPANTQCTISAIKSGYSFIDQNTTTGSSLNWSSVSGNQWGIDFTASNPSAPTAESQNCNVHCLDNVTIALVAVDDHLPDPPAAISYIITSLPAHGTLSISDAEEIESVPYTLPNNSNTVIYQPCQYYSGSDEFTFIADDGGSAPTGGLSDPATISLTVDGSISADFGLDGTWGNNAAIDTGYYALRSQALYLAEDIGDHGYLTNLSMKFTGIPPLVLNNWTIRMQLTSMSQYDDVVSDFITSGWTTVYQTDLSVSQTGWVSFQLDIPFYFDDSYNLLIDFSFDNTATSSSTGWYLCKEIGCDCDRILTVKSSNAVHDSPLTWDFWAGGGYYWGGDWLPSIKLAGDVAVAPIAGDFDFSCSVNLPDMTTIAKAWNTQSGDSDYNQACDISMPADNAINMLDLSVFAENWLTEM